MSSVYKLTLTSDRYSNDPNYRAEVIEFESKEKFDEYVKGEYKFCFKEYRDYAKAFLKEEREEKFAKLVAMRKAFKNKWSKTVTETSKELA